MPSKHILTLTFLALLAAWLFSFCKTTGADKSPFLNLQDSVKYVGMATCRSCHANVHETFIHTGMGRSFDLATLEKTAARFGSHDVIYDTLNNFYYHPFFKDSVLYVLEYRLENGDTVHRRQEKISYIIGSGQHTNSHLIDINGYLCQAPVTWYTQEGKWDMAPGFRENNSRFSRFLTSECITCHNNYPEMVPGSLNKFVKMPQGIECERCHGPGQLHVEEKLKGIIVDTSKQADYTIVNPRRLPRDLQMDLCQRCHLQGIAVTEEGKTFFDFKPGMKLSAVLNVFLPRYTDTHEKFIMASQADRLRMSKCYENSEELSCLTCHHPHKSVEVTPVNQYNNACKKCHSQKDAATCTAPAAERAAKSDNCVNCHMPRSGSIDIPHVRITDHRIAKPQLPAAALHQKPAFLGIEILTKKNPTPLDMAKGYLATHDKYIASPVMLDSAQYYLALSKESFEKKFSTLVHYLFLRGDYNGILENLGRLPAGKTLDGWTAYRIAEAFFSKDDNLQALKYFQQAAAEFPFHLDFLEKTGVAQIGLQRLEEGKTTLEWVLKENPNRPLALCNLGYAFALSGDIEKAMQLYDRAIALDPGYEQALVNKAALLIFQKKNKDAEKLLKRVLKINPENAQALQALQLF